MMLVFCVLSCLMSMNRVLILVLVRVEVGLFMMSILVLKDRVLVILIICCLVMVSLLMCCCGLRWMLRCCSSLVVWWLSFCFDRNGFVVGLCFM